LSADGGASIQDATGVKGTLEVRMAFEEDNNMSCLEFVGEEVEIGDK